MSGRFGITRRQFLGGCVAAAGAAAIASHLLLGDAPAAVSRRRPNILLISTDQWHAEAFGHRGCTWLKTPNVDRLASSGVVFERSYSADPVCSPARTSWMTGRMPSEHGVIANGGFSVLPSLPDFGQWFGSHGYRTAHFGKWDTPRRKPQSSFQAWHDLHAPGQLADFSVSQMASAYLMGQRHDKPFLMHVSFMNPHDICQVACHSSGAGKLPLADLRDLPPLPANYAARPTESATFTEKVRKSPRRSPCWGWNDRDWQYYRWVYYRYCETIDAAIGQVLDALEACGQADNTLVVFTSDHGEGLGHHGLDSKAFLYEEAARVPLILSLPGRLGLSAVDRKTFTSGVDLFPTFCAAAGIECPPDLCGQDILGQYQSGKPAREALVISASFGGRMVVDGRYKMIRYLNDPTVQLFDMQQDPGETKNVADEQKAVVGRLQLALKEFEGRLKPFPLSAGASDVYKQYRYEE